jgi:YegS/Rv2252/BmrU family lipid kinase
VVVFLQRSRNNTRVRICVIFNPAAKGEKARRFRRHLDEIGAESALKLTTGPGDARTLAAQAVQEGFEIVVAAGGDGTLNEVLNGLGDAPEGFERARLGVLPLGTVNVFARELGLSRNIAQAWQTLRKGNETRIDLPRAEYEEGGQGRQRYFAQMAGAGLDARAVELVNWQIKKRFGPLAYVWAGLQALAGAQSQIRAKTSTQEAAGELVLVGNGRLYGGDYRIFEGADLRDGLLDVSVFPRINWLTLAWCAPSLLLRGSLPRGLVTVLQAPEFTLSTPTRAPFELDGEWVGHLPAKFSVERSRLRVIVP